MSFDEIKKGNLTVNSLNVNNTYTLPTVDGTAGQVPTTDGAGVVSWENISSGGTAWGDITGTLSSQTDLYLVINELSAAISAKSDKLITENAQSGASYTLVLSDANKLVSMNNGSGNTLTVPNNTDVTFPMGTQILVKQKGAGATTFSPGVGVTIESYLNKVVSLGQYSLFTLIKTDTNTWSLGGNLT